MKPIPSRFDLVPREAKLVGSNQNRARRYRAIRMFVISMDIALEKLFLLSYFMTDPSLSPLKYV